MLTRNRAYNNILNSSKQSSLGNQQGSGNVSAHVPKTHEGR